MDISGYDIVASAQKEGIHTQVVVLNNNSTHYIVATRKDDTVTHALHRATFRYYDDAPSALRALHHALLFMAQMVVDSHRED